MRWNAREVNNLNANARRAFDGEDPLTAPREWPHRSPLTGNGRAQARAERAYGLDPGSVEWLQTKGRASTLGSSAQRIWWFLRQLADRGLPTGPDVDLEDASVRALYEELLAKAERGNLLDMPGAGHQLSGLRGALRVFYRGLTADGLRLRPIPGALLQAQDTHGNTARLRATLPVADQRGLDRLFGRFDDLTRDQQAGKTQGSRRRKTTIAQGTLRVYSTNLNSILAHARDAGWSYDLDAIFTPVHVVDWAMRGHQTIGFPMGKRGPGQRRRMICALLTRALDVGEPIVDRDRVRRIAAALDEYRGPMNVEGRRRGHDDEKFIPTLQQIVDAIAVVNEDFQRALVRYENHHLTRLEFHRALQEYAFFHLRLRGMWRNDTAATIDLMQARRDQDTGAVIVAGVRAKEVSNEYFREIILVPEMIDFVEQLLEFEGRTIERPLRTGERPQHLRAEQKELQGTLLVVTTRGDHWGLDRLKTESLDVVNLFRRHPDRPEQLTYGEIERMSRRILRRIGWVGAIPHSFRVAGAIYWRMLGWDYEQIMHLGLWRDLRTLLACYARLNEKDRLASLASLAPSRHFRSPRDLDTRRGAALRSIHRSVVDLLISKDAHLTDYERAAPELRRCIDELDRANAAARGRVWVTPRPSLLDEREIVKIDEAFRSLHQDGLKELLGRDVLTTDRVLTQKREAAANADPSPRLRRLFAQSIPAEPSSESSDVSAERAM